MKRILVAFFVIVGLSNSCIRKKDVQEINLCPCKNAERFIFFTKMESCLLKSGVLGREKHSYYKLIKYVETQRILIKPHNIVSDTIVDPHAFLLVEHDMVSLCIDSLYTLNPILFKDSKAIVDDFILSDFGKPISDSTLERAALDIDTNNGNRLALQLFLWIKILQVDALRYDKMLKEKTKDGFIDLDSIELDY